VIFFFAWVGVGCGIVEYELRYNSIRDGNLTDSKKVQFLVLLSINATCTFGVVVGIVSRYLLTL